MLYKEIGKTGIKASALGIGSSSFRNSPPGLGGRLLEQAMELGINYYDTAHSYKHGEEAIGCLPREIRHKFIVTTKTGARGGIRCIKDLQHSLKTMQRDHIDIWMTHMIETEHEYALCTELGGFCDIAEASKKSGLVRASGASFHAPTHVILRAIEERVFDVVMFQMNLIGRETVFGSSIASYREQLLPAAGNNNVGVVVMKVLAGGEMRHGAPGLRPVSDTSLVCNDITCCVRYAVMHPGIDIAVVGMSGTEELVQNWNAVRDLSEKDQETCENWINRVAQIDLGECTRCGSCLDCCPQKIEIPKIMRLFDQQRFFGMNGMARYKYSQIEVSAPACEACGKCDGICPEGLNIPEMIEQAHKSLNEDIAKPYTV